MKNSFKAFSAFLIAVFSTYDQYQASKRFYYNGDSEAELNAAASALKSITDHINGKTTKAIFHLWSFLYNGGHTLAVCLLFSVWTNIRLFSRVSPLC